MSRLAHVQVGQSERGVCGRPRAGLGAGRRRGVAVWLVEAGWYALVALVLASAAPRRLYLGARAIFDRLAGTVMALLGLRLILTAARS